MFLIDINRKHDLILPNYQFINPVMPNGKKGHTYLNKPAAKKSRLI